jgi:hypothetical protein
MDCFTADILPAITQVKSLNGTAESTCVTCLAHVESGNQTFLTFFPPKREPVDYFFVNCDDCWEEFRNNLAEGGRLIEDRALRVGAQAQAPTMTDSAWASLDL